MASEPVREARDGQRQAAPAGNTSPVGVIEVHVTELRQIFDAMDPAPFHDRDLDPTAVEYIVSWAREMPRHAPLSLLVYLDRSAGLPDESALLGDAIRRFFSGRGTATRRRLKQLMRSGRFSLLIGLAFLALAITISQFVGNLWPDQGWGDVLRESVLIGGWVAMWRPIEIFLYDWWPILAEARLYDRLAAMPVRIQYSSTEVSDAWQHDWPATSAAGPARQPDAARAS